MQESTRVSHGAFVLLSAAAAIAICYTTYRQFWSSDTESSSDTKLHRSNAVRRRRRAWRSGSRGMEIEYDTSRINAALEHLSQREASGMGYGYYHNENYVHADLVSSHNEDLSLLPSKLALIRDIVSHAHDMSEEMDSQLMVHVQAMFLQEFLKEEFPEGQMSDLEIEQLSARLEPEIEPELVKSIVELRNEGQDVEEDMVFSEQAVERADGQLPHPEDLASVLQQHAAEDRRNNNTGRWNDGAQESSEGNNVLDLLYRIGEEKAKWSGYQHRGVQCNGCSMTPIRGIRYHCANCWDFDLCEACEHQQIHHKTHVFYKIRIPAPTRGQIKLVQPKWYPGDPNACPESIPQSLKIHLLQATNVDRQDLDALYDQFKCIAGKSFPNDKDGIGMAIDRRSFEKYFTSTTADRPPKPNLIYDRIFSFYDKNDDGLISFSEFSIGMADLANNTSREARIERLFGAFDLDGDGYVSRRDFLNMLQAYYALNKELAHEMVFAREDAFLTDEEMLEVIHGSNPISAAFGGSNFAAHRSRHGRGKHVDITGDLVLDDELDDVLKEDSTLVGDRAEAIARQASEARGLIHGRQSMNEDQQQDDPIVYGYHLPPVPTMREEDSIMGSPRSRNEGIENLGHISDNWPLDDVLQQDVQQALGAEISVEDVMDPMDRRRVLTARRDRLFSELEENNQEVEQSALQDRWQRRVFYTDIQQGFDLSGRYAESDSSEYASDSPMNNVGDPPSKQEIMQMSLRSRSSSKVRFDESTIENDNESKSDISSRNTPVNERWGGVEMSQPDRDIGIEVIYEAVQEAFNDMLNHFFKEKEDKAMEAKRTRHYRNRFAAELHAYNGLTGETAEHSLNDTKKRARPRDTVAEIEADFRAYLLKKIEDERALEATAESRTFNDPTLPQNRPNADGFVASYPRSPRFEDVKIDKALLKLWYEHEMIEKDGDEAGGLGRLSKQEFRQKLRDEYSDIDIGSEATDEHFWEAKADLGKFSFLSDWLEMASF